jgi:hypothetical protein
VNLQIQDLARLAFGRHFEGAAADLAISRKPLYCGACIDNQIKALAAIGTSDHFADFHIQSRSAMKGEEQIAKSSL